MDKVTMDRAGRRPEDPPVGEPRSRFRLPLPQRLIPVLLGGLLLAGTMEAIVTCSDGPLGAPGFGWEKRDGEILVSEVREETQGDEVVFVPFVRYRFQADYNVHKGTVIRERPLIFDRREKAEAWLARYPVGKTVTVHQARFQRSYTLLDRDLTYGWTQLLVRAALLALLSWALFTQWKRNSLAYLQGRERPVFEKAPRPMRAAEPGEVHPGKANYRRSAGARIRPTQGYRQLPPGGG